jgi:hypothetical protein
MFIKQKLNNKKIIHDLRQKQKVKKKKTYQEKKEVKIIKYAVRKAYNPGEDTIIIDMAVIISHTTC